MATTVRFVPGAGERDVAPKRMCEEQAGALKDAIRLSIGGQYPAALKALRTQFTATDSAYYFAAIVDRLKFD